jgi:succinate dehydrogenase / fumarate reductase iron-sulfur subunit
MRIGRQIMAVNIRVRRFDPSVDTSAHFQEFSVQIPEDEEWTVMDALDYIHENMDSSVSYHRHSSCDRGICARCAVRVNGRPRVICQFLCPTEGEIVLEPVKKNVVKDLVAR